MLHLHTSFDLSPDVSIADYQKVVDGFSEDMLARGLLQSTGPILERCHHPVMDTDERKQEYFFIISFRDREQCDQAVAHLQPGQQPVNELHESLFAKIENSVFVCWEDIP